MKASLEKIFTYLYHRPGIKSSVIILNIACLNIPVKTGKFQKKQPEEGGKYQKSPENREFLLVIFIEFSIIFLYDVV